MNESLAGLVVARRALEAGRRGEPVALAERGSAPRFDPVTNADPFVIPGAVIADFVVERAADPMHLVDLGAAPRRAREADQPPHRPAIVGREIQKCWVVLAAYHGVSSGRALFLSSATIDRGQASAPCADRAAIMSAVHCCSGL